jgi:hypothetical protein
VPDLPDSVIRAFVEEWTHGLTADSLAPNLTCRETETLAAVLDHIGHNNNAAVWREIHSVGDAHHQVHHPGTDCQGLAIALDRTVTAWRANNAHAARLSCALIARRLRNARLYAATLSLDVTRDEGGQLTPSSWGDRWGRNHKLDDFLANQIDGIAGNLLPENSPAWHPLCTTVDDRMGHYILNLSDAFQAAYTEWGA